MKAVRIYGQSIAYKLHLSQAIGCFQLFLREMGQLGHFLESGGEEQTRLMYIFEEDGQWHYSGNDQ